MMYKVMAVGYYQHRDESLRAKIVSCRLVVIIANKINKKRNYADGETISQWNSSVLQHFAFVGQKTGNAHQLSKWQWRPSVDWCVYMKCSCGGDVCCTGLVCPHTPHWHTLPASQGSSHNTIINANQQLILYQNHKTNHYNQCGQD